MKQLIIGLVTVTLAGASTTPVSVGETNRRATGAAIDVRSFAAEVELVEREIARPSELSRDNLLMMFGRSSAASGQLAVAAAAYGMFLNDFGTSHPYAERAASGLADSLFPFKYDEVNVVHVPSGPRLDAVWCMDYTPRWEHLQQAMPAFELAASLTHDQHAKGSALLKLGWVHRVLGDWDASTAVWDRCANEAAPTKPAADALWLAAENLEWTNRPAEAAEHLARMAREHPEDARASAAIDRVEYLQAEARRSPEWLSDPVASLQSEIQARAGARTTGEVYRSFVTWLQRRGERTAIIAVSRWAYQQADWSEKERTAARYDLVDVLLAGDDSESRAEAVEQLRTMVDLTSETASAVTVGLRCCRVLTELGRYDEADELMRALGERVQGTRKWEPIVLSQHAEWLLERNDVARATDVLDTLKTRHPEYDLSEQFGGTKLSRKEGGR